MSTEEKQTHIDAAKLLGLDQTNAAAYGYTLGSSSGFAHPELVLPHYTNMVYGTVEAALNKSTMSNEEKDAVRDIAGWAHSQAVNIANQFASTRPSREQSVGHAAGR